MHRINLKELLSRARDGGYAIGAFNIFNHQSVRAAVEAAQRERMPIIAQTSVSTVRAFGPRALLRLIDSARAGTAVEVLVHLDHCTDAGLAKECIDAGWDSVMVDFSGLPFEENAEATAAVRRYARPRGACVEGELGVIAGVEEEVSARRECATLYDEAMRFLARTGVDAFAPAIGTAHGVYKRAVRLDYALITRLRESTGVPVVIHGGTGLSAEQFGRLVRCGAAKINVSTALKRAYLDAASDYLRAHPGDYNPLAFDDFVTGRVRETVLWHIRCFCPGAGGEGEAHAAFTGAAV